MCIFCYKTVQYACWVVLKHGIINRVNVKQGFGDGGKLKSQRLLLMVVFVFMFLSLAATLASYNFSYADPRIVDASFVYRGWPLHWVVESWSWWSPPEHPHSFHFEPLNFLVDNVFWAVVFQLPTVTLLLLKGSPKKHNPNV